MFLTRRQDFRTDEAVDIEDLDAGYIVGWMEIDEYLRYTVDVTEDGMRHLPQDTKTSVAFIKR